MTTARVNGVELFYELAGVGETPLVLVHGSWSSHDTWALVLERLGDSFRALTYDRRGHSRSERPPGQGSVHEDVADLAALIEHAGIAPAWVLGNSFGASIVLRIAGERPELLRGVIAHEPPLFSLASRSGRAPEGIDTSAVAERIASGDSAGAAELFVETAIGAGTWSLLPSERRETFIQNAPTFLDEERDPEADTLDVRRTSAFSGPVLLTLGDHSPPAFASVIRMLAEALPGAEVVTLPGVGHIPHTTHPNLYADTIAAFIDKSAHASSERP